MNYYGQQPSQDPYRDPSQPDPYAQAYADYPDAYSPNIGYGADYAQPPVSGAMVPAEDYYYPTGPAGMYYQMLPEHPQGTSIMVLSLLGVFVFPPLAYVAAYMGTKARSEIRMNPGRYAESSTITAGWVIGIIGSVLCTIYLLLVAVVILLFLAV